jgi:hypothetical protein
MSRTTARGGCGFEADEAGRNRFGSTVTGTREFTS